MEPTRDKQVTVETGSRVPSEHDEKLAPMETEGRRHSAAGAEAADVYGNAGEAEEFGYVERG
jgi:hypothetical protein